MSTRPEDFSARHIGITDADIASMLAELKFQNLEEFLQSIVPESILDKSSLNLPQALSESQAIRKLKEISKKNKAYKSFIGSGFYNCNVPNVIKRNVFENPGWYTSYTPYQPEIAQGRLEALMNYQTMISDLTGMDVSNASLLDEPTAAAEAMMLSLIHI